MPVKNKLVRCQITLEFLSDVLACRTSGNVTTNAPADLRVVSLYTDRSIFKGGVFAIIESESFCEVNEGDEIPVIPPFEYIKEDAAK